MNNSSDASIELILNDENRKRLRVHEEMIVERQNLLLDDYKHIPPFELTPELFLALYGLDSAQTRSFKTKKYIAHKTNARLTHSKEDAGDLEIKDVFFELKLSFNLYGIINIRQLRPWQKTHLLVGHINEEEFSKSHFFLLSFEEMMIEIERKGSFTHGTQEINNTNTHQEYSLTINCTPGNAEFERWKERYSTDLVHDVCLEKITPEQFQQELLSTVTQVNKKKLREELEKELEQKEQMRKQLENQE